MDPLRSTSVSRSSRSLACRSSSSPTARPMCLVLVTTLESSSSSSSCSRMRFRCSCRMLRLSSLSSSTSTRWLSPGYTCAGDVNGNVDGPFMASARSSDRARSSRSMFSRRRDSRSVTTALTRSVRSASSLEVRVSAFRITAAVSRAASGLLPRAAQLSLSRTVANASSTSSSASSNRASHPSFMVEMQRVNFNHEEDTRRMAPLTSGAVEETMPPCAGVTRWMAAAEMSAVTSPNLPRTVSRVGKI